MLAECLWTSLCCPAFRRARSPFRKVVPMDRWIVKLLALVALAACGGPGVEPNPANCVELPPDALHWWTGDGEGTDRVGTAHATLMHGATYAPGLVESGGGQAFSFDGIDAIGMVDDAPTLNPTGPFTVMAWAKPKPYPWSGAVIGKGHPWQESWVLGNHNGYWNGFIRSAGGLAANVYGPEVATGVWTHVAMRWNGAVIELYIDGVLEDESGIKSIRRTNASVGIGARSEEGFNDELDLEFIGEIDEIVFFSRALDEDELQAVVEAAEDGICKS